jgi:hypothetical protein
LANVDTLAQTAQNPLPIEHCEEQVRRVIQSATFRNATTLQQLLQFLAVKTLSGSSEILKEYTIGVEALGRKTDFDPKIDPIVRMRSHRLRLKLKEYYQVEGSSDPILIQFPKGHYFPTFEPMPATTPVFAESIIGEHDEQTFAGGDPAPARLPRPNRSAVTRIGNPSSLQSSQSWSQSSLIGWVTGTRRDD